MICGVVLTSGAGRHRAARGSEAEERGGEVDLVGGALGAAPAGLPGGRVARPVGRDGRRRKGGTDHARFPFRWLRAQHSPVVTLRTYRSPASFLTPGKT